MIGEMSSKILGIVICFVAFGFIANVGEWASGRTRGFPFMMMMSKFGDASVCFPGSLQVALAMIAAVWAKLKTLGNKPESSEKKTMTSQCDHN